MNTDKTQPSSSYQPGVSLGDLQLILEKTPERVWHVLRGQRIFITGGTGFVGCWLLEGLLWANQQLELGLSITILSRNPDAFIAKAPHLATHHIVNLIQGDVSDLHTINDAFDTVIHAATDVAKANANPMSIFNDMVQGTNETLKLAQRCKATRYLLTSSGAVYGRQPASLTHISESYSGAPDTGDVNTAYGQAKRVSEWLAQCCAQQTDLKVSVARCFALIGPYLPLDAHFAAGNFIRDALDNKTIAVSSDGTTLRSYLYAADMVVWLLTILVNGRLAQKYNLGSDQAISIKNLAEKISVTIYNENRVSIATAPDLQKPIQQYVPDITKAKTELALFPFTDLDSAIQKTIDWEIRRRNLTHHKNDEINT
jgi:nucleoside-diphosphate-sugar epimerase